MSVKKLSLLLFAAVAFMDMTTVVNASTKTVSIYSQCNPATNSSCVCFADGTCVDVDDPVIHP